MLNRLKSTWREYPANFWALVLATFIDRLGGTMVFTFFALYVTQKFDVGMTEAGILFAIFSISGFIGSMVGGALTDRFGRRGVVLFSLVFSALSSVLMGLVNDLYVLYGLAVGVGLLSDVGGPARQAMVADILPEEKQADGFGMLRVAGNLSWIIGPTVGGILAAHSYMWLFILDAVTSLITAGIFFRFVPETKPEKGDQETDGGMLESLAGYRHVAADRTYVAFVIVSIVMLIAYQQMYSTLSVYLRDVHDVPARGYGFLMSINAFTVVLLQFWITRRTKRYPQMLMMALGVTFYMVGFSLYGVVETFMLFLVAMLIITFGEMIVIPVGQALVARFAPEDMRGRYMAFYGLAWTIPSAIGPWAAGLVMDNYDPRWVWYLSGVLCAVAIVGYYALHLGAKGRLVEEGKIEATHVSPV
jgi:MFS family permease